MARFVRGVQADGSWYVYAGDRNRVLWKFISADPVDVTGAVITAQARKDDIDPVAALTAAVEMTDPTQGVVHISWDGEEVRTLLGGASTWQGVYDIQVVWPGQTLPDTVHRASMYAQMDVTREDQP